jgi:predicted restriction endonuclease
LVIPKVDFALLQQSYFVKLANKSKKSASIAIRKYQSQYRDKIIARDKMCVITNIETLQVCEASHLKPYCRCTAKEQSNPINGILLSATFHKFLDEGLISFDPNTGKIILSRFLPTRDKI